MNCYYLSSFRFFFFFLKKKQYKTARKLTDHAVLRCSVLYVPIKHVHEVLHVDKVIQPWYILEICFHIHITCKGHSEETSDPAEVWLTGNARQKRDARAHVPLPTPMTCSPATTPRPESSFRASQGKVACQLGWPRQQGHPPTITINLMLSREVLILVHQQVFKASGPNGLSEGEKGMKLCSLPDPWERGLSRVKG